MFPIGLFLIFLAAVIIVILIKFKNVKKAPPEVIVQEPVEDIFQDLDIKSEEPKVKSVPKKELAKPKAKKKPAKKTVHGRTVTKSSPKKKIKSKK